MRGKSALLGLVWLLLVVSLTGCWDVMEMRYDSYILGIGLDRVATDQLEVSLLQQQFSVGKPNGKNGGAEKSEFQTHVLSARGKSIGDCMQQIRNKTMKRLTLEKAVFIILGREEAEKGDRENWDYISRTNEIDQSILLFLAKKDAKSVLEAEKGKLIEFALRGYNYKTAFATEKFWNFTPNLYSPLEGASLPIIDIVNEDLKLEGAGLFQGSKLVQRLNQNQAFLLNILRNRKVEHVHIYSDNEMTHTVHIAREKRKFHWKRDALQMDIVLRGPLIQSKTENPMANKEAIEKQLAERLERDLNELVRTIHKNSVDILGIGEKHRQKGWDTKDWAQKLKEFPVEIKVKVDITYGYGKKT